MKHSGDLDLNMKSLGKGSDCPARRMVTLDISVIVLCLVTLVATQDVSDCTWKPQSEVEEGASALECDLKTLQTVPSDIPQVSTVTLLLFELKLDVKKVFLFNLTIYKCCNLL